MNKAVVTGASGFIGKALTKMLLDRGHSVCAVVRNKVQMEDMQHPNLELVEADFLDYARLAERIEQSTYDTFFHLAWDGTFGNSFQDYHRQLNNAAYAADALMAAVKLKCRKFILTGTIVELEVLQHIREATGALRTSCIYGASKIAAEVICHTLAEQNEISFNTAVLASVYGEGDHSNMIQNVLIRSLLKKKSPPLIAGKNLYDWIYIKDAAAALIAISEYGKSGKTYYVGHEELQTFESLVKSTRDIVDPDVKLEFGAFPDSVAIDYSMIDRSALFTDTGFRCCEDFKSSIQKTADWLRKQEEEK